MSTQAEYFTSKTRCLEDYASRLFWNSRNVPPASILKTLNYFETTLLSILKDLTMKKQLRNKIFSDGLNKLSENFSWRGSCNFPDLDYPILFDGLVALIPALKDVTSDKKELINVLFNCLSLLMVFVDESTQAELPVIVAESLNAFSKTNGTLQVFVMETLSNKIVPLCLGSLPRNEEFEMNTNGIPRIITFVMEEINDIRQHYKLIETLMLIKEDLWKDLMIVIAYNDGRTIRSAAQLLFHYFPELNASKPIEHKVRTESFYRRLKCGNQKCTSEIAEISSFASFIIFDPFMAAKHGSTSPPLYLCFNCCKTLLGNDEDITKVALMMPISKISGKCFNFHLEKCEQPSSQQTKLTAVCSQMFAKGINSYKSYYDRTLDGGITHRLIYDEESYEVEAQELIRYCEPCLKKVESSLDPSSGLMIQTSPKCAWDYLDEDTRQLVVDCILSLLTNDTSNQMAGKMSQRSMVGKDILNSHNGDGGVCGDFNNDFIDADTYSCMACFDCLWHHDEVYIVGHYGVWLLVSLCPPSSRIPKEQASQLIAAVVVWFGKNSRLTNDKFGNELERLKTKYLVKWLQQMYHYYPSIFVSVLIPNPPPECRIQGHWDKILPAWKQYKEVLELITCLASYSVVNLSIWEVIISAWMTAISRNLDSTEVLKLKLVVNGLFDKNMSPLAVSQDQLFGFANKLFNQSLRVDQERVLQWLQVLCEIEVYFPFESIIEMFLQAQSFLCFSSDTQAVNMRNSVKVELADSQLIYEMKKLIEDVESDAYGIETFETAFAKASVDLINLKNKDTEWLRAKPENREKDVSKRSMTSSIRRNSSQSRRFPAVKEALSKFSPAYLQRTRSQRSYKGKKSFSSKQLRSSFIGTTEFVRQQSLNSEDLTNKTETHETENSQVNFRQCTDLDDALLISCFVEIIDIILQQIHLQAFVRYEALLNQKRYEKLFELLNIFVSRLVKRSNTRQQSLSSNLSDELKKKLNETECWLLEIFYDTLSELLKYILPKMEIVRRNFNLEVSKGDSKAEEPSSSSYFKKWVDSNFSFPVQLLRNLLLVLISNPPIKVRTSIVMSVSLLCIHCYIGDPSMAPRSLRDPVLWKFEKDILFDGLWKQLLLRHSNLAHVTVPIVFACISSLHSFFKATVDFFESAFTDDNTGQDISIENLSPMLISIDQVHSLLVFADGTLFSSQCHATHIIALSMCTIINCFNSSNTLIVTKSKFIINSLSIRSIKDASRCMEIEFDAGTTDRCTLLTALLKLHQLRNDANVFSFTFFTRRIDALAHESRLYQAFEHRHPFPTSVCSQNLNSDHEPAPKRNPEDNKTFASYDVLEKAMLHFMTIMCEFMIDCEKDAEISCSYQALGVFVRQFYGLIGYSDDVSQFTCNTLELYSSIGFHSFLSAAPKILDRSLTLGNTLLPMIFLLLEVSVLPSKQTFKIAPHDSSGNPCQHYSLQQLPEALRMSWLSALQVIMYKYELMDADHEKQLYLLIIICLNTIEGAYHKCSRGMLVVDTYEISVDDDDEPFQKPLSKMKKSKTSFSNERANEAVPSYNECFPLDEEVDDAEKNKTPPKYMDAVKILSSDPELQSLRTSCEASCSREIKKSSSFEPQSSESETKKKEDLNFSQILELEKSKKRNLALKCGRCHHPLNKLGSNVLSLCMINLGHYVRFDPCSAVPLLPRILEQLAAVYQPVHHHGSLNLGASAVHKFGISSITLVAKQEIRYILRQLADLQILTRIFFKNTQFGNCFIPVLVSCLRNYTELPLCDVISLVIKGMNDETSNLKTSSINKLLSNMAVFISSLVDLTAGSGNWHQTITQMQLFFNKIQSYISSSNHPPSFDRLLRLMSLTLKVPAPASVKQILLEPYSKILSNLLTNERFSLQNLQELCCSAYQCFTKERDMLALMRVISNKLVAALKNTASYMVEYNILSIIQLILQDIGSCLGGCLSIYFYTANSRMASCHACEMIRIQLNELLDFVGNENSFRSRKSDQSGRNLTLPLSNKYSYIRPFEASDLKIAIGLMIAYEFSEEKKHLNTYFPLLSSRPSNLQRGPKEFQESLNFVKKFNWILLASLERVSLEEDVEIWKPLPVDQTSSIANVIQVVLTECLETNKYEESAMAPLFYASIFCQLWTIYCEQITHFSKPKPYISQIDSSCKLSDGIPESTFHLLEFWSKITPSLLVLLGKDEISGVVRRNIESMIKTLQQYDSAILLLLYKMWQPMLAIKDLKSCQQENDNLLETTLNTVEEETEFSSIQNIGKIIYEMKNKLALIDKGEGLSAI